MVFTTTFNNNSVTFVYRCGQLIRGGNLSTQKKNQTCRKLLTNSTCSTYLSLQTFFHWQYLCRSDDSWLIHHAVCRHTNVSLLNITTSMFQGWQKSGKYSYFPGWWEILGNKIDS